MGSARTLYDHFVTDAYEFFDGSISTTSGGKDCRKPGKIKVTISGGTSLQKQLDAFDIAVPDVPFVKPTLSEKVAKVKAHLFYGWDVDLLGLVPGDDKDAIEEALSFCTKSLHKASGAAARAYCGGCVWKHHRAGSLKIGCHYSLSWKKGEGCHYILIGGHIPLALAYYVDGVHEFSVKCTCSPLGGPLTF